MFFPSVGSIPGRLGSQLCVARCKRACFCLDRQHGDMAVAATRWWGEVEMALLVLTGAVAKGEGQWAVTGRE